jgi:mannose-1-phosphate guanylyltransferase
MGLGIRKAFILAGGEGTRLRPLTYEIAKPLLPVKGKPVLQWNIELAKQTGAKEIVLAVGYKHEQIEQYFGNGKKFGVKLHYNVEDRFLGTGGALKLAEEHFRKEKKFAMMNGDECKEVDFDALDRVFEEEKAVAAIALAPVEHVSAGGLVKLEGRRIAGWDEHPEKEESGVINAGAYILGPAILDYIPAGKMVSIERETFPLLIREKKVFGLQCVPQFYQTDTFERYGKAISGWKGFASAPAQ